MAEDRTLHVPVRGMDCAECTRHVQKAIADLPGVVSVDVFLASEKAVVRLDPDRVTLNAIQKAVDDAGYSIPDQEAESDVPAMGGFSRRALTVLGLVFGVVVLVVVLGEWLGFIDRLTARVPFLLGVALVLAAGWPVFRNVWRASWNGQITSHTLMTLGVLAALAVGQWATAAVVVLFMRVGDYVESYTTESARRAVRDLTALAPQMARVIRQDREEEVAIGEVAVGDLVVVRPGELIPVDGHVIAGYATVDQSAITGESMPVEVAAGHKVFAATTAQGGSLRVEVSRVGPDTTFGRVVALVEEAEANRSQVQRFADRFSTYFLPLVAGLALVTLVVRRDPLAAAAVLVVACSCSIALATPIAMLAAIGRAAQQGLLIKGGKYLELLARADVLLIDKTGTLTLGQPQITDVVPLAHLTAREVLALAATAERYSEHPLAEAVRAFAVAEGLVPADPEQFEALPGLGVRAVIEGQEIIVGSRRLVPGAEASIQGTLIPESAGTLLYVARNGTLVGVLAAADTLRPEVPAALVRVKSFGLRHVELLTGDREAVAASLANQLGIPFRAGLLPEDKIAVVKEFQARGHTVIMVGDGVNDAPALAQADVGIAMGAAGSDVAIEAAHVALMREDWSLVPDLFLTAHRTFGVVRGNLAFTAAYNVVGLSLAALGLLPPALAAAAQSLPDLGILLNSSRLLRRSPS